MPGLCLEEVTTLSTNGIGRFEFRARYVRRCLPDALRCGPHCIRPFRWPPSNAFARESDCRALKYRIIFRVGRIRDGIWKRFNRTEFDRRNSLQNTGATNERACAPGRIA